MKKMKLVGFITFFITLITYGQSTEMQNNWKLIEGADYTIQYPETWELNESGQMGTKFILFSKQVSPQDKFRENVNLIVQDLSGQSINLDKYVEISEEQIRTFLTNGKLIESKRLKESENEFHKMIYTGDQGIYKLKFEQYYLIKNNNAYVLTLTCETEQFDSYREIGENILNSLTLK
jgi:hypothetical protein